MRVREGVNQWIQRVPRNGVQKNSDGRVERLDNKTALNPKDDNARVSAAAFSRRIPVKMLVLLAHGYIFPADIHNATRLRWTDGREFTSNWLS